MTVQLSSPYHNQLITIIQRVMSGTHGSVLLFGSRARGDARTTSDIDIAIDIEADGSVVAGRLREECENSTLPHTVDVIDLRLSDPKLEAEVKRDGKLLWNA